MNWTKITRHKHTKKRCTYMYNTYIYILYMETIWKPMQNKQTSPTFLDPPRLGIQRSHWTSWRDRGSDRPFQGAFGMLAFGEGNQPHIHLIWLVVSTHLKNISQNGNLPQIGVNKKIFETTHQTLHSGYWVYQYIIVYPLLKILMKWAHLG